MNFHCLFGYNCADATQLKWKIWWRFTLRRLSVSTKGNRLVLLRINFSFIENKLLARFNLLVNLSLCEFLYVCMKLQSALSQFELWFSFFLFSVQLNVLLINCIRSISVNWTKQKLNLLKLSHKLSVCVWACVFGSDIPESFHFVHLRNNI